jgi:hypothetical protein
MSATLPEPGTPVLVRTPEVRGPGVVTDSNDHWKYIRVLLDSGHRATVHAHEFEVIGAVCEEETK